MIKYETFSTRPAIFKRLTGLTLEEFEVIYDKFYSAWQNYFQGKYLGKTRQRAYGAGRHATLSTLRDKLLFILIYTRVYPLLFIQGILFGISESGACYWVHELLPLLEEALGHAHVLPSRKGRGRNLSEILEEFPELGELGLLTDGVERPVRRPKRDEAQQEKYSGKKKRHTVKNDLLTHPKTNRILYLSDTYPGKTHDKEILDREKEHLGVRGVRWKDKIPLGGDSGFQGLDLPGTRLVVPTKKPKGGELTKAQKQHNTALSKARIRVEHATCGVKRNRSVSDIYRNWSDQTSDRLMDVACGLHNLRVACRYCPAN